MLKNEIAVDLVGCINCGAVKTVVSDSRTIVRDSIHFTRRKRECVKCDTKYWTKEVVDFPVRPYERRKNI